MSLEQMGFQIRFEVESIDRLLFNSYAELLGLVQRKEPTLAEMTALAGVLHSFYNGVENIFLSIMKNLDQENLSGAGWHKELLEKMTVEIRDRKPVITIKIASQLEDYLGFRHFFRHSYCDLLEWDKLGRLVSLVVDVWNQLKAEVNIFLASAGLHP